MSRYYYYRLWVQEQKETRKIQRTMIRDASNPFELPEVEFRHIYRVCKEMALYLCAELESDLQPHNNDGLPVYIKVLTSLHFLADGNYQRGTGQDHGLCVAQTTVSSYLAQFTDAVYRRYQENALKPNNRLRGRWVVFPGTDQSRRMVAGQFRAAHGVPNILGTIDCTHVKIFPPPLPYSVQYLNRKGSHSINVQLVADVNCKVIAVNARYPGRTHDSFIFNNSVIKTELKRLYNNHIGEYFLLGDSGYALEPWLMTPILNATPDSPEERYTNWHCRVRNGIERTNGYIKNVFRCLGHDRALHYSPYRASEIINCCCVLYNMMHHYRTIDSNAELETTDAEDTETTTQQFPENGQLLRVAQEKRANIVNNYFS